MDYKNINDYELLYLIKDTDEGYKNILYEKYYPIISNICYKYLKKFNNYNLEYDDLFQEGFIGLSYAINNFTPKRNVVFYTYAIICIESKIKDYLRGSGREKSLILTEAISLNLEIRENVFLEDTIVIDNIVDKNLLLNEIYENLIIFKNNLSNREAEVFELRINGFKYEEIAILLDIKKNNIYSYVKQIRKKFKNMRVIDCFF